MPNDEILEPIHVGKAISRYKDEMLWMRRDDTGDNISSKNGSYCEMTAHFGSGRTSSPYTNARRTLAYMVELPTGVYFIHRQLRIKTVPYDKMEDGRKVLVAYTEEEMRNMELYESLFQNELSDNVIADRKEKFDNPAILLGLKNDGIVIQ